MTDIFFDGLDWGIDFDSFGSFDATLSLKMVCCGDVFCFRLALYSLFANRIRLINSFAIAMFGSTGDVQ